MTHFASHRKLARATMAVLASLTVAGTAHADSLVWDGGGADQFFDTANNWNLNQSPTPTDDVFFPSAAVAPAMTPLWEDADSVLSLSVDNSGGFVWQLPRSGSSNPRTITIGAGGLSVTGGGTTTWGAEFTSIGAAQVWNIGTGTTLSFLSGADITGSNKITKTGGGTIEAGAISSGFSGGWDITAGRFTNGAITTNPYGTGATKISGTGELNLNLTSGSVSGGAITLANGGTLSGRTGTLITGDLGVPNISASIAVDTTANTTAIIRATTPGENFRLTSGFSGGISHTDSVIRIQGPGQVHLLNGNTSSTAFLGTWKVESGGTLRAESTSSLGVRDNTTPSRLELAGGTILWCGSSGSTPVTFTNPILVTADSTMSMDKTGAAGTAPNNAGAIARTLGPITIGEDILTVNVTSKITGPQVAGPARMGGTSVTLTGNATFNVVKPGSFDLSFATTTISDGGNGYGYTKSGTGWMTVSSASNYSGPTKVLGGTLFLNNTGALGQTSELHVGAGAVANLTSGAWTTKADLTGSGTISLGGGSTLTAQGSNVAPGASPGILTVNGNLSLALDGAALSTLTIEVDSDGGVAGVDFDRLAVSGTLSGIQNTNLVVDFTGATGDFTGDVLTIVTANSILGGAFANDGNITFLGGGSATVNYSSNAITLSNIAIPEPTSLAVLSLAGIGLFARRRRGT